MWSELPLSSLAHITSGGTPSRDNPAFWGGEIPWVTPTDISACRGNYVFDTADRITRTGLLSSSAKLLPAGAILFTSRATVGISRIAGVSVCTNQGFKSLTPFQHVDGTFLFYQVQRLRGAFERYAAGSTFPEINKKDTGRIPIPHPTCRQEQRRIGAVLTSIDTAIEKTEALIEKYQQIKAGLMHDLFTRGVLPNGQLRPHREQEPDLYQETIDGSIPAEWDVKALGVACEWYSGGTPSKGNNAWWNGTLPWLSPKDMKRFELADTQDHVTRQAALLGSRVVPKETVFIVVRGMILAHSFPVVLSSVEFSFNQDVKAIIGRPPLGNRFLAYWLVAKTEQFLRKTTEATHGTKRFDLRDLYSIVIGLPSIAEQQRIVSRLDAIEKLVDSKTVQLDKLRAQKLGLMQDLLTGKVPVKAAAAEMEPA